MFQEASIVLVKAIENYRFDTDMRFLPYYSHCLMNHFNSLGRKSLANKRRSLNNAVSMDYISELSGSEFVHSSFVSPDSDPADQSIATETFEEYASRLSKLEMEVFKLYLVNHSFDKIAETLGIDVSKVKSAVYRCSSKLKNSLC